MCLLYFYCCITVEYLKNGHYIFNNFKVNGTLFIFKLKELIA